MRRLGLLLWAGAMLAWTASAQSAVSGQASGSASAGVSGQSSGQRDKGTEASSSARASGSSSASASTGPAALNVNDGTAVNADLMTTLDAKKCKPGDKVEARTTQDVKQDGRVVMKKGSRIHGHVTEAEARTKGHEESSLGVVFDSVSLKGGERVPLHMGVQALAAASSATAASMAGNDEMMSGGGAAMGSARATGGGLLGGAGGAVGGAAGATAGAAGGVAGNAGRDLGGTVGSATHATGSVAGTAGGLDAVGRLTSSSSGVFGLEGLNLASSASNATEASVVTSSTRNVHLDSGTQMVLRVAKQ